MDLTKYDESAVRKVYARWAPIYDWSFGWVSDLARKTAVKEINQGQGRVLEVGVGTGLSLPHYAKHLEVTGIDMSVDMLQKARERVNSQSLDNVAGIHEMDAAQLTFPDAYFDTVVAMYVMTVVPDVDRVMAELRRVCKPGGKIILLNHFFDGHGIKGVVERALAGYATTIGWHSDFEKESVLGHEGLELTYETKLWPMNIFTLMVFQRESVKPALEAVSPQGDSTDAVAKKPSAKEVA